MGSIQLLNETAYREVLKLAPRYFFNQTAENARAAAGEGREVRLIGYAEEGELRAAAKLSLLPHHRFYRYASIAWLPNYFRRDPAMFGRFLRALVDWSRKESRLTALRVAPLEARRFHNADGPGAPRRAARDLERELEKLGFVCLSRDLYSDASLQPRYLYSKVIRACSEEEVFASLDRRVRNHIRVCRRYGMKLEFLQGEKCAVFNELLQQTAVRTEIPPGILSFSPAGASPEDSNISYPAVYLIPCRSLRDNEEEIKKITAAREELDRCGENKARARQLEQQPAAARSRKKRLQEIADRVQDGEAKVYLAASQFAFSPSDCINLQSAVADAYVDLSPIYLIHEAMLRRAIRQEQSYYNFFAISEPGEAAADAGVHRFKAQFRGCVEVYPGAYEKVLRCPLLCSLAEGLKRLRF